MSVVINNSHFEMMDCGQCGITFYVPLSFYNERWNDGGNWHCPNGHRRIFVEPEVPRLNKVVAQKDKRIATLETESLTFKMGLENREKELVKLRARVKKLRKKRG